MYSVNFLKMAVVACKLIEEEQSLFHLKESLEKKRISDLHSSSIDRQNEDTTLCIKFSRWQMLDLIFSVFARLLWLQ